MGRRLSARRWLLGLLLLLAIACSASISAHKPRATRKGGSIEQDVPAQRVRLPRRLSSRHNELGPGTESGRKSSGSSHMLIGGHLRLAEPTTADAGTTKPAKKNDSTLEDGLLLSSAGNGKEKKSTTSADSSSDDDDKKTLSQQVKEGKYGLIQNELFAERPKRPGIISYSANAEVPRDNLKSLGGLDEDEIWLAEDHVLVLKGGGFPKEETGAPDEQRSKPDWQPIDDYEAPQRQVKIPSQPDVPPPFPVQLTPGGPYELIGLNGTSVVGNSTIDFQALPVGFRGFLPGEGPYFSLQPQPPSTSEAPAAERKTKAEKSGLYGSLPPGAVIVPPPSNQTDYDDEDQSIYYPPPYSFVYAQDNSTDIPPGPLVPGIILPPPPDFFSPLDDEKRPSSPDKPKYGKRPETTSTPLGKGPAYTPPRHKPSTKIYKTPSVTASPLGAKTAAYNAKLAGRHKYKNTTYQPYVQPDKTTAQRAYPNILSDFVEFTTQSPARPTTLESPDKYRHIQPVLSNQVIETSSEKPWRPSGLVTSKPVPLVTFFASTTPTSIEQPVETTPSAVKNVLTTEAPPSRYPSQASYYFYEEAATAEDTPAPPSSTPGPVVYFSTTPEPLPYYKLELEPRDQPEEQPSQAPQPQELEEEEERGQKKDYYDVEMIPSQQTSKDYNVKLIDSIVKEPQIYRYLDSGATSSQDKFEAAPVRNQSPRMLHSEPLYYQPLPTRPSPKLSYFTSPKPKPFYRRPEAAEESYSYKPANKPKPIYQYSFEASNYKREREAAGLSQKPEITESLQRVRPRLQSQARRQKELPIYAEYQDIQSVADGQYEYEGSEPVAEQQPRTEKPPPPPPVYHKERAYYRQPQPQPQSTTASPVRETTLASHQQYFTKQDEQLLDEVTKEYFTMFGKKLAGKLPSTTPLYGKSSVTERPSYAPGPSHGSSFASNEYEPPAAAGFRSPQNVKVHYGDHTPGPYSLKDDILVNYNRPLPPLEPEAEFISVIGPTARPLPAVGPKYRPRPAALLQLQPGRHREYSSGGQQRQRYEPPLRDYEDKPQRQLQRPLLQGQFETGFRPARPLSLSSDLGVNYKEPRPALEPEAEFIPGGPVSRLDKPGNSYFAYRLPGDGGHFYFLTPQAINREDQNAGYLYARPPNTRLVRRRRARDND